MNKIHALAAVALLAFTLSFAPTAAGESLPGVATPGRLVVGLDDTFAPMGFRDTEGNLVGFDIDLARELGGELGVEIVFQPVDWGTKELELATKNVDCLWNGMSRTKEREVSMTLSQNYLNNKLVVMTNPGVTITALDQLAQHQVGTQAASSALEAIKGHQVYPLIKDNVHEYATYDDCILDMRAGRIQAMVVDEVLGQYKNNNLGTALGVAPVGFGDDFYVIGFRRDQNGDNSENEALRRAVEGGLKRLIANGKAAEISKKWFGANLMLPIE